MRIFSLTDVGVKRENNEDYLLVNEELNLFVVADGMGGHNAGEVAARIACETIEREISRRLNEGSFDFQSEIESILNVANMEIKNRGADSIELKNMGTTVVVVYIDGETLHSANVGDSRLYLFDNDALEQISKDHSLVAELVKIGSISETEAFTHPDRNIITSALGVDDSFEIYKTFISIGDKRFKLAILCTDGLTNMVSAEEIIAIIKESGMPDLPKNLINNANENGGFDNVTVICVEL